jgi:Collagenase
VRSMTRMTCWLGTVLAVCAAENQPAARAAAGLAQETEKSASAKQTPPDDANFGMIIADKKDAAVVADLQKPMREGRKRIEEFFGKPFPRPFVTEVFAQRSTFDAYFQKRWKVPKTERWMVAAGVGDRFLLLTPRVWKSEAVEHNPNDATHVRELVAHELVHVFHGQQNPTGDFDGMDDLGWFVEGLATYVSGQLSHEHRTAASEAIQAGKAPSRLADAWSGRYRYGVSGSMVEFVDQRWGRATIGKMLAATKPDAALKLLGVTEQQFLEDWRKFVLAGGK